jgi:LytS/YehU family sensor histidine kinase
LNFLKNQYNPHFLFNTINSIFFLIHKSPDKAAASLAKFSELLRYQLYECNDRQIPLNRELVYLENAVELEKLRLNKNVTVDFKISQAPIAHVGIAPFILMTFVENAFKHVSKNPDQHNWITITLNIHQDQLELFVGNSTTADTYIPLTAYSGIGLKNVQRRLDLIYPEKYELETQHQQNSYAVTLRLQLSRLAATETITTLSQPSTIYK